MPSHKNAPDNRSTSAGPEAATGAAPVRAAVQATRVTNLAVERRLRRMAVQRIGRPDVEAAFVSVDLARLRRFLTHAERTSSRTIVRRTDPREVSI